MGQRGWGMLSVLALNFFQMENLLISNLMIQKLYLIKMKITLSDLNNMSLKEACELMASIRDEVEDVYFKVTPLDVKIIIVRRLEDGRTKGNGC